MADFPFFKDDEKTSDEKNKKSSHHDDDSYLDDMEALLGNKVEGKQKRKKYSKEGKNTMVLWGIILVLSLVVIAGALYISLRGNSNQVHIGADEQHYKTKVLDKDDEGLPMEGGDNIYTFLERQQQEKSDVPEHATQIPADMLADERASQKEEESRQWRGNNDSFSISEDFIEAQDANEASPAAVLKPAPKPVSTQKQPPKASSTPSASIESKAKPTQTKTTQKTETKQPIKKTAQETKIKEAWKVQLVATKIEENAEGEWTRLQKKYPKMFEGKSKEIKKGTLNGEDVYKLWVVPFDSKNSATDFCNKAKNSGISCIPLK